MARNKVCLIGNKRLCVSRRYASLSTQGGVMGGVGYGITSGGGLSGRAKVFWALAAGAILGPAVIGTSSFDGAGSAIAGAAAGMFVDGRLLREEIRDDDGSIIAVVTPKNSLSGFAASVVAGGGMMNVLS